MRSERCSSVPYTSDELLALLEEWGITSSTTEHAAVFTVEESQRLRGEIPGAHTKNLFLRDDKKNYFLVVVEEDRVVDLKALRKLIGARGGLSFASEQALREILGIETGAVSPLAVVNDVEKRVKVAIERSISFSQLINCHPLVNTRTTSLAPAQLETYLEKTGHAPMWIDLGS